MAASDDAYASGVAAAQNLAARLRAALRDVDEAMRAIAAAMAEHGRQA